MPQHAADQADIAAVFQEMRGKGMAEEMAGTALADVRLTHQPMHPRAHQLAHAGRWPLVEEQPLLVCLLAPRGTHRGDVAAHPGQSASPNGAIAILSALAGDHPHDAAHRVQIIEFQPQG